MKVYRIVDWEKNYECNRTREVKEVRWIPVPVKQDGYGYCVLTATNGAARLGAWLAILQTAAKSQVRGTLLRDGRHAHTAESIALKARISAKDVEDAINVCLGHDVGWIEVIDIEGDTPKEEEQPATFSQEGATRSRKCALHNSTLHNKTVQDMVGGVGDATVPQPDKHSTAQSVADDRPGRRSPPAMADADWVGKNSEEYRAQGVDVEREHVKATQWCKANGKPLTVRRFVNWLNRSIDSADYRRARSSERASAASRAATSDEPDWAKLYRSTYKARQGVDVALFESAVKSAHKNLNTERARALLAKCISRLEHNKARDSFYCPTPGELAREVGEQIKRDKMLADYERTKAQQGTHPPASLCGEVAGFSEANKEVDRDE